MISTSNDIAVGDVRVFVDLLLTKSLPVLGSMTDVILGAVGLGWA
jgi:hypothetical protein